ncbi:hypothetical protein RFI_04237 [Reticulomyxa filosa]|uniref:Uncharacterized protein n=1 Tax=Reticulomyxa filosa TaxID=46433 RepID=X6P493_RETFI|nr:hypothetical protein RFI_04237 [Reticulomyxa filosa]|eukprot:ETO32879.1 hypothetical protein RFI_04237 [Reticulomyxa filosa]
MYQGAIQHYDAIHKPPSAKDDEFEKEELYLDEIEERMKKYDKKYRNTDEYNALWNEFGWEDQTDRRAKKNSFFLECKIAFIHYGTPNEEGAQFGRGKKINPSNYINGDLYSPVKRQPIPPVQFLTAEQVRRSRGSLANFRELPPETSSIWKTWNGHAVFATFLVLWLTKEQVVFTSHDVWEGVLTWSFFGVGMAIFADWFTWS